MSRIVTLYSYRGGTGKTTTAVNLARLLAERGERVAVVDTALRAPALHTLFNLGDIPEWISFTDYLIGRCTLEDAVQPIELAEDAAAAGGSLYAVPACDRSYKLEAIITRGYDIGLLHEAFYQLIEHLKLDTLVLDTFPGMTNETATAVARSDALVMMTRADRAALVAAPKAVDVVAGLSAGRRLLAVSLLTETELGEQFGELLARAYGAPVAALLPAAPELAEAPAKTFFVDAFPSHPLTSEYRRLADSLDGVA